MVYVRNDDWRSTVMKEAGSIILPMAGRYSYFLDRNKSINERWEMIPNNFTWLLNNYLHRFKMEECVEAIGNSSCLTSTFALEKNVTATLAGNTCNTTIKPCIATLDSYADKPAVISLTVATQALGFDTKHLGNTNNELISEDDTRISQSIIRALTAAIKVLPIHKPTVYITPLFRNNIYLPTDENKFNKNWDVPNYINSMLMLLGRYNLDKYDIHVFIRNAPPLRFNPHAN